MVTGEERISHCHVVQARTKTSREGTFTTSTAFLTMWQSRCHSALKLALLTTRSSLVQPLS